MFDSTPFIGKAYYGRKAGTEVMDRLKSARHTIKIVSPYLSQKLISVLLDKAAQGVDVTLVGSSLFRVGNGITGQIILRRFYTL